MSQRDMTDPSKPSSSTSPPPDWEGIGRYLAGESSPEEAAAVRRWLDQHPEDAQLVASLDSAARSAASSGGPRVEVEAALARVKERARSGVRGAAIRFTGFAAVAAALLLVAVLVPWSSVFDRAQNSSNTSAPVALSTDVGQRDSVMLPDSSLVVLGPQTRITYAMQADQRVVELDGQAFFRVTHQERRPFVVLTKGSSIRDIGTEFSVQSTQAEPVRIVVHEGVVEVRAEGAPGDTLRAGDVALIESGKVETRRGVATSDDLAWMRGQLVFRDKQLGEIASDLRRWYGVELRVTDSALLRRHFTGTFVTSEPARTLVDALAMAIGARVASHGDTLILRSAGSTK
jgi:transmembrane sensor